MSPLLFQFLRALWFALRERVSCLDELDMCTTRLRLQLPGEPATDDIHVIHPLQVQRYILLTIAIWFLSRFFLVKTQAKSVFCFFFLGCLFLEVISNNLRNNDFVVPRVNTTGYGKQSIRYLGPVLWSKIDKKLRELKTLYEFKRKIRMADLAKHILPNNCINCTLCHS